MRILPDGTIVYPTRGDPPPVPAGYMRAPGDSYKLIRIIPECIYRSYVDACNSCGSKRMICGLHMRATDRLQCAECKEATPN